MIHTGIHSLLFFFCFVFYIYFIHALFPYNCMGQLISTNPHRIELNVCVCVRMLGFVLITLIQAVNSS